MIVDIIIPSIGRADRLAGLVANIHANTEATHNVVIVTEDFDEDTKAAVADLDALLVINERTENYAGAVNTAYDHSAADFLFCGADDLEFHPHWDAECFKVLDNWVMVAGTNDLLNPYVMRGAHSTHSLVDRRYLDEIGGVVDVGPGSFLPECYDHNFTDTEFIGTAKMRARFQPCLTSIVEHHHVLKGAPADATHERSVRKFLDDEALYDARRDLWFGLTR